jgi:hypothetical protein
MALRKRVGTRLEVAGGEIIARVGSSAAASFDPLELDDVIELALGLLGDARAEATPAEVACALAVGELTQSDDGGAPAGSAIDRAQLLAACADPLELALDEPAHARAQDTYLFTRSFVAGPITGHALDPDYAKKRECRRALGALRPAPLPDGARPLFERLSELALRAGLRRISLSAPHQHAALDLIERLRAALRPALVLHLGRHAAGLQPLGGLQLALRRAQDQLRSTLDLTLGNAVARFADGAPLSREEGVVALRELLRQASSSGRRVWIVLDRPREIDRASLTVVTEAVAEQAGDHLLWLLVDDYGTPGGLLLGADEHEAVAMEPLSERDRAQVAETVLGLETGSELGMRVARLGGDTALGILEAARTLVGSGDLVIDAGVFRWRTQPRGSSLPIPVDALLTERAAGLEPAAHRTLEALCVAPPAASSELIARVMALDGLSPDAAAGGLAQLRLEGWLDEHGGLGPLEHADRSAVRNGMPPARPSFTASWPTSWARKPRSRAVPATGTRCWRITWPRVDASSKPRTRC